MAGSSVFEYIHSDDHVELAEQLGLTLTSSSPTSSVASSAAASLVNASLTASSSPSSLTSDDGCAGSGGNSQTGGTMNPDGKKKICMPMSLSSSSRYRGYDRAFCIRMKSTLTKRGCHFKSSGYRVVLVLGHLRPKAQFHSHHQNEQKNPPNLMGLVALAIALPSPSVNEMKLEPDMFVSRINMDFRLAHCEAKVSDLLHYTPEELLGRSLYALCHAQDVENLRKTHTDLMKKGQVMSPYYRILNRTGGWVWVQTCATVICNSKSSDEQNIICVNYVLSGSVDNSVILDEHQMTPSVAHVKSDVTNDFGRQHSPSRSGSNTPTPQRTNSPSLKPLTPSMSVGCDSLTPPLIDHHNHHHRQNGSLHGVTKDLVHEAVLESRMHNPHDTHLQESHHHDIRSSSQMDHDQQVMMSDTHLSHGGPLTPHNDTHIPHVAPLTPQLTPVSRIGGLTPIVSAEGETIKTETGSILTPLTVPEHLDDIMHSQKLSPITPQSHMHYTSLPSHTQLSPAAINRFSPISNTQISPNHQYPTMEKVPQHDSEGSVRHLEAAMTRHLPQDGMMDSGGVGVGVTTSLGGLSEGFHTIQWAGGQENHSSSTILRQLCSTKRESVIKTSRDPQEIIVNPNSAHCTAPTIITSLPTTTSSGLMSVPSGYPGYQISPPSSVSPDRLKTMTCEPYTDLYNSNIYPSAHVSSKNPYDPVRWYQT